MSFTFGDPSLVNVGPGWVTFRAEECKVVLHEQDREAKS